MNVSIVVPNDVEEWIVPSEILAPALKFQELGAIVCKEDVFFNSVFQHLDVGDIAILYKPLKDPKRKDLFRKAKFTKALRVIDPRGTDGYLHRKNLAAHFDNGPFDFWLLAYPNSDHIKHIQSHGIRGIVFSHCLAFKDAQPPDEVFAMKKYDLLVSGQMHEKFYPVRWKIAQRLLEKDNISGCLLPHPGYGMNDEPLRHNYIGENYVELCKQFWLAANGCGHADGMHMKTLEFAKSYTLPVGNAPTYLEESITKHILKIGIDESPEETYDEFIRVASQKDYLRERIVAYSSAVREHYDIDVIIPRVYEKIITGEFDF